jgi:hypothetical protein
MLLSLWVAGCGKSSSSVSGKVAYKGQPVKGGIVTFFGNNNWTGNSAISEDGSYSIAQVPKGTVQITVDTKSLKPNPMANKMPGPPPGTYNPNAPNGATPSADRYVAHPGEVCRQGPIRSEFRVQGRQANLRY